MLGGIGSTEISGFKGGVGWCYRGRHRVEEDNLKVKKSRLVYNFKLRRERRGDGCNYDDM